MRRYLLSLISFLCLAAFACQAQRVPSWMNELPQADNDTYVYVRESGEGATINDALNQAMARVLQSTANRLGQPFDSQKVNAALQSGSHYEVIALQYNIPINKVDQYDIRLKDGTYRVFVLCQVARAGNVQPVWGVVRPKGESSGWTALLKSAVVPGLGQMGKGYYGEGVTTLLGEAVLVGGGIGCYYLAQQQLQKMGDSQVAYADYTAARNSYNTYRTTSYIAWGAAGALYVYNLIRAATMQPKRIQAVALQPTLVASPFTISPSVSLTFNF